MDKQNKGTAHIRVKICCKRALREKDTHQAREHPPVADVPLLGLLPFHYAVSSCRVRMKCNKLVLDTSVILAIEALETPLVSNI